MQKEVFGRYYKIKVSVGRYRGREFAIIDKRSAHGKTGCMRQCFHFRLNLGDD